MGSGDRLEDAVPAGEALRFRAPLRRGGHVGLTDERLLVVDGETTAVPLSAIDEVTFQSFDWFLAVLSAVLVAIGVFGVTEQGNPFLGGVFIAVAVSSLYWTYRKRGRVRIRVDTRAKPLAFSLDADEELHEALSSALDRYEGRLEE